MNSYDKKVLAIIVAEQHKRLNLNPQPKPPTIWERLLRLAMTERT